MDDRCFIALHNSKGETKYREVSKKHPGNKCTIYPPKDFDGCIHGEILNRSQIEDPHLTFTIEHDVLDFQLEEYRNLEKLLSNMEVEYSYMKNSNFFYEETDGQPCPDTNEIGNVKPLSIDGCILLNSTGNIQVFDNGTPVYIPIRVSGKFTLKDSKIIDVKVEQEQYSANDESKAD